MSGDMLAVYRHDAHKFVRQSHAQASETYAGVRVNERVPFGADGDAAALSRPVGEPDTTVETHTNHRRLSLCTGTTQNLDGVNVDDAMHGLVTERDAERAHEQWLASDVAGWFNESVYYPYTSLKYHTLLVAALVRAYEEGSTFADLRLVVDPPESVVPHRTVFAGDEFALRITPESPKRPRIRLGDTPSRSWAGAWSRLPEHPLGTDDDAWAMVLDANLRRIQSWSTALQYVEDFERWSA
ncbi:hypothetical protein GCM10009037_19680 [Halarchaeum grantii]|uniref:DUF8168 domain-containing protein n=1 Tax=Halarchaeum grantii TaxID=1193105 RepID=A0A830EY43_9EURY|nr:hypothetical protein [Halarchaeum grantii]GGL36184.1 hypothetical protein GCM10009037_19680 [Halarchaeum grantii]